MTIYGEQKAVSSKTQEKVIGFALCAMFLALCGSVQAQQPSKIHRIGFLSGGFPGPTHWTARLRAELQKIGYVEDKNITIESRFAENKPERLPPWLMSWSVSKLTSSLRVVRTTPEPPRMRPRRFPLL